MTKATETNLLGLAFLTAAASSLHIVENLLMRLLPLPFIRIGLSNVVILYLIYKNMPWQALIVNLSKSVLGGLFTFTLLSPATVLSVSGGLAAIFAMLLAKWLKLGFSIFGISICGAIANNIIQLAIVHAFIVKSNQVFVLTPLLLSIALLNGSVIAYITLYIDTRIKLPDWGER